MPERPNGGCSQDPPPRVNQHLHGRSLARSTQIHAARSMPCRLRGCISPRRYAGRSKIVGHPTRSRLPSAKVSAIVTFKAVDAPSAPSQHSDESKHIAPLGDPRCPRRSADQSCVDGWAFRRQPRQGVAGGLRKAMGYPHIMAGTAIFVAVFLRLWGRLAHGRPSYPAGEPNWATALARVTHGARLRGRLRNERTLPPSQRAHLADLPRRARGGAGRRYLDGLRLGRVRRQGDIGVRFADPAGAGRWYHNGIPRARPRMPAPERASLVPPGRPHGPDRPLDRLHARHRPAVADQTAVQDPGDRVGLRRVRRRARSDRAAPFPTRRRHSPQGLAPLGHPIRPAGPQLHGQHLPRFPHHHNRMNESQT